MTTCTVCGRPLDEAAVEQNDDRCTDCLARIERAPLADPVASVATVELSEGDDDRPAWQRRKGWTVAELLATEFPPMRMAVPGLLAEGLSLLVGAPKVGKSWLALDIALAVAAGGHALGALPVEKGGVLYLALEDGPRRVKDRIRLLIGEGARAPDALKVYNDWSRGVDAPRDVADYLDTHQGVRLVVVDVLAKVRQRRGGNGDRYADDYADLTPWQQLATHYGVAVLLLHHDRKAEAADFVDAVSGTHGVAGSADSVLHLVRARMENYGTLSLTGRDVMEREVALMRAGPAWVAHDGPVPDGSLGERSREVLEMVAQRGEVTPAEVAAALDMPANQAAVYLSRLVESGRLVKRGRGRYAIPTDTTDATG